MSKSKVKRKKPLAYSLGTTKDQLSSRSGLLTLVKVLQALKLEQQANRLFPPPGSNRGYQSGEILNTFIMMLNEGGKCLEDVRYLQAERELLELEGIDKIPDADTLGRWLKRYGESGIPIVRSINRTVLGAALEMLGYQQVTLDIDATAILANKSGTKWTYYGERGYMPIVGTLAQSGQVVAVDFRAGNVPPSADNLAFIKLCLQQLPEGIKLKSVRIDAAGYQRNIIEYLDNKGIEFVIRARLDSTVKELIASTDESQWQPLEQRDGSPSQQEWTVRRLHIMDNSDTPFELVIQRCLKETDPKLPLQQELPGMSIDERIEIGKYVYRAIATNCCGRDDSQVVHFYNQRGEYSENRIKELKSDFAARRVPCSDFDANALYVTVCALAYNVFALLRATLPSEFRFSRAPTVRIRLYGLGAKIVRHGRRCMLKLRVCHRHLLERVFKSIYENLKPLLLDSRYPLRI